MIGDKKRDVFREIYTVGLGFFQQNGNSHFQFGRFNGNREPSAEARDQAVFDTGDLFGIGIAGNDDLFVSLDQCVECVEKFLLRAIFAVEKLNVVYQEQIERVIVLFKTVESFVLISAHNVRNILLRMNVSNAGRRIELDQHVADGLDQMGLAQPDAAVDEQRVVGNPGMLCNLQGGGTRKLVGFPGHERIESK